MPKPRQNYAIVEWTFLRFDPRWRALPDDEARAYVTLWALCLQLRRDRFSKAEISSEWFRDMLGVGADCLARMVVSGVASGLLSRGPGGLVTVDGVRSKHPTIRRWNEQGMITQSTPDLRPDRTGPETKGKESEDFAFHALKTGIKSGQITSCKRNGVVLKALISNDGKGFVLDVQDGIAQQIRIFGQEALDALGEVTWH